MRDVKPKRPARASKESERSPGAVLPIEVAPTIIPEDIPAPEVVAAPPAAVAEAIPEILSAEPAAIAEPVPEIVAAVVEPQADSGEDAWTAFAEAQAVFARGFEEIAVEVSGMTRSGFAAAADATVALIVGSAKLSEIGAKAVEDASRPILSQLAGNWSGLALG